MIKIKVPSKYNNIKISEYIKNVSPHLTITNIKKKINKGYIKVNHHKVLDNYLLQKNDELMIYLNIKQGNEHYKKTTLKVPIFYEDENIIIFNKPKNVSCQENVNQKFNTLNNYLKAYCYNKKNWDGVSKEDEPCLINRLDHNTSGLVLAAKNKNVARILNKNYSTQITKKYLALVYCHYQLKPQLLIDYLTKNDNNKVSVTSNKNNICQIIKTKFDILYQKDHYYLLEIELITGRKHQIRSHLSFHQIYLIGDSKYGIKVKNSKITSQCLIANEIKFNLKNAQLKYLNSKKFKLIKDYSKIIKLID